MKTVDKAMSLLRQFSLDKTEIGLNELARLTCQDKAVTRRLLLSLMDHGFIEQNPESSRYYLGHGFLSLARIREATMPMVRSTHIVCQWLCTTTNETVHVSVPGRTGMSTVAYRLPPRGNIINLRPADSYPYHSSASGLAYLSFSTPGKREQILDLPRERLTPYTLTERDDLLAYVEVTRARGYAFTRNTVEQGVASVAMPFFVDTEENPTGTISIAVPDANLTEDHRDLLVERLCTAVEKLEISLKG